MTQENIDTILNRLNEIQTKNDEDHARVQAQLEKGAADFQAQLEKGAADNANSYARLESRLQGFQAKNVSHYVDLRDQLSALSAIVQK